VYDSSEESRQEYHRLLAEWSANHQQLPVPQSALTISELAYRFSAPGAAMEITSIALHTASQFLAQSSKPIPVDSVKDRIAHTFLPCRA
jgi:hypothetical protein